MHSTSESRDLYLLNPKICSIPVKKFMSSSPLVSSFPNEFGKVELSNLKKLMAGYWINDPFTKKRYS